MKSSHRVRLAALLALAPLLTAPGIRAQGVSVEPRLPAPPAPPRPVVAVAAIDEDGSPVHEALREAHEEVARAMRDVQRQVRTFRFDAGGANATRLLVIPEPGSTGGDLGQTREDLAIMSRLLQKAASPEARGNSRFRFDFGDVRLGGKTDLDAMYLAGYGAVFLLEVDFPLNAPPRQEATKNSTKEKRDAAWEEARREVSGAGSADSAEWEEDEDESGGYDGDKVDRLKERITAALRSAINVRALKPDERVVVQVTGRGSRGGSRAIFLHSDDRKPGKVTREERRSGGGFAVLTFQTTRKEIGALADGSVNADEFARKLSVTLRDEADPNGPSERRKH